MTDFDRSQLTRRESQIMDALYRRGKATAADVREDIEDAPGYSTVRKLLEILERKGHVRHEAVANRYVYFPRVPREQASRSALRDVLETFFQGSPERLVETLTDIEDLELTDDQLDRLRDAFRQEPED